MNLPERILLLFILLCPMIVSAQVSQEHEAYGGLFSKSEVKAFHEQWDYVFGWFGGELMRYANLNVDKLFPLATVSARGKAVSDLVFADGDFGKAGFGGQFLHVSPRRDLVVAWFGTFGKDMINPDLQSVARQISTSSLFEGAER